MSRNERAARLAAGGLAAAVILPLSVLVLGLPVWAGLAAALGVLGAVVVAPWPKRSPSAATKSGAAAPAAVSQALAAEAIPALDRLHALAAAIEDREIAGLLGDIAAAGARLLADETAQADRAAQRLLSYYLPEAAALADSAGRLKLDVRVQHDLRARLVSVLQGVLAAFDAHAASDEAEDRKALDRDIRLVAAALQEDLSQPR